MEKRNAGATGLMLALEGNALVLYRVMIDAGGKITNKTRLHNPGGQARYSRRLLRQEPNVRRETRHERSSRSRSGRMTCRLCLMR